MKSSPSGCVYPSSGEKNAETMFKRFSVIYLSDTPHAFVMIY